MPPLKSVGKNLLCASLLASGGADTWLVDASLVLSHLYIVFGPMS